MKRLAAWAELVVELTGLLWKTSVLRLFPIIVAALACLPLLLPRRHLDRDALHGD